MFSVAQTVRNATGKPVKLFPWSRIRRDYKPESPAITCCSRACWASSTARLQETSYDKAKSEGDKKGGLAYDATSTGGWAGITDKYWLTSLIPDQAIAVEGEFPPHRGPRRPLPGRLRVDRSADRPGQRRRDDDQPRVRRRQGGDRCWTTTRSEFHIPSFDKAVDFGLVLLPDQADLLRAGLAERRCWAISASPSWCSPSS